MGVFTTRSVAYRTEAEGVEALVAKEDKTRVQSSAPVATASAPTALCQLRSCTVSPKKPCNVVFVRNSSNFHQLNNFWHIDNKDEKVRSENLELLNSSNSSVTNLGYL